MPDSVYRAIGSAVTFSHTDEQISKGYRVQRIKDENRLSMLGKQLRWLELSTNEPDMPDSRFARMRFMADGRETHAVFRWPLLNGDTKRGNFLLERFLYASSNLTPWGGVSLNDCRCLAVES